MKVLPNLPYEYDALEPYVDAETMHFHRDKHHHAYLDKLNKALEKHPEINDSVEELLKNPDLIPEDIKTEVLQNGGQFLNHNLFFDILKKYEDIPNPMLSELQKNFGSLDAFEKMFSETALSVFGSGWAWLVVGKDRTLKIVKTQNHENPVMFGLTPVLAIDVWEHAYYLKYKNNRADYIKNFFNVINWEKVNENFIDAINKMEEK